MTLVDLVGVNLFGQESRQVGQNGIAPGTVFSTLFRERADQFYMQATHEHLADKARFAPLGFPCGLGHG